MADLTSKHLFEPEEVMAYLDGQLPEQQAALVSAHLKECGGCQSLVQDMQSVSTKMEEWTVPTEQLQMNPALAGLVKKMSPKRDWAWNWKWATAGVCAVAALVIVVPFVMNIYRMQPLPTAQNGSALTAPEAPPPALFQVRPQVRSAADRTGAGQSQVSDAQSQAIDQLERSGNAVKLIRTKSPMIARTAQLVIVTKDFAKVRPELDAILNRHQGYIGQLSTSGADNSHTLEATLRVPTNQLDATLAELKKFGRVDMESQSGEELTQQYTDLEARLTNARNSEQRLTGILRERTGRLADVLDVEREIERVRGEIESMDAQRKAMSNRVDFATINLTVREDYRAQLNVTPDSTFARFRNAAVEGYRSMLEGVITLILLALSYGPTLLVWAAVLFFPAKWAWKRRFRVAGN